MLRIIGVFLAFFFSATLALVSSALIIEHQGEKYALWRAPKPPVKIRY